MLDLAVVIVEIAFKYCISTFKPSTAKSISTFQRKDLLISTEEVKRGNQYR